MRKLTRLSKLIIFGKSNMGSFNKRNEANAGSLANYKTYYISNVYKASDSINEGSSIRPPQAPLNVKVRTPGVQDEDIGKKVLEFASEQFYNNKFDRQFVTKQTKQNRDRVICNYFDMLDTRAKTHPRLRNVNSLNYLKKAVSTVAMRSNILFCIDVEAWEFDQNMITEIGIAIYDPSLQQDAMFPYVRSIHIIVQEYEDKNNGKYVLDNKDKFLGGKSLVMSKKASISFIQSLINHYFVHVPKNSNMGCVLVGHDLKGDVSWFKKMKVHFPENVQQLDTQSIWGTTHGVNGNSLSKLLRFMNIPHTHLHNAGNDAYYTMILCLNLCDPQLRTMFRLDNEVFPEDEPIPLRRLTKGKWGAPAPDGGKGGRRGRASRKKGAGCDIMGKTQVNNSREALFETFDRMAS